MSKKKEIYTMSVSSDYISPPYIIKNEKRKITQKIYNRKNRIYTYFTSVKDYIDAIEYAYGGDEKMSIKIEKIEVNENAIGFMEFTAVRSVVLNENEVYRMMDTQFVEFYNKDDIIKMPFDQTPVIKSNGIYKVRFIDEDASRMILTDEIDYDTIESMNDVFKEAIENLTFEQDSDNEDITIYTTGRVDQHFNTHSDVVAQYAKHELVKSNIVEAIYAIHFF